MAVTGKSAQYLPAVCLVLAGAVKSLAFTSNTLFQPSHTHPNKEKIHLIAGANVLFLLSVHSRQRHTRTVTSNHISFTFIDASIVARETKNHIEFRTTEKAVFYFFIKGRESSISNWYFLAVIVYLHCLLSCATCYTSIPDIHVQVGVRWVYTTAPWTSAYNSGFITWCSK